MSDDLSARLCAAIRDVPDFPKPGILFKDISTLLLQPSLFTEAIDAIGSAFGDAGVTHVVALEARGFLFGAGLSLRLDLPLVIMRKPGKLPAATIQEEYQLEYGTAALEVHCDALCAGDRAMIVDDVLATGGTAAAAGRLVMRCGAILAGYAFLAELDFLGGREKLSAAPVYSVLHYT